MVTGKRTSTEALIGGEVLRPRLPSPLPLAGQLLPAVS